MPRIAGLLHVSLLVSDLDRSRAFYEGVLGLVPDPGRPVMSFPGVWYAIGRAQIHLICLDSCAPGSALWSEPPPVGAKSFLGRPGERLESPDPATGRPAHGGRDRHVALAVEGWEALRHSLEAAGIPFTLSRSGRRALFIRDPDGNALELVDNGGDQIHAA